MTTRAITGVANDAGFTGRYSHCGGYPTYHGPLLQRIYRELGEDWEQVRDWVIRAEDGYWSSLLSPSEVAAYAALPQQTPRQLCGGTGVRNDQYVKGKCNGCAGTGWERNPNIIPGWRADGSALITQQDTEGAEWVYLLDARGITVLEVCWNEGQGDSFTRVGQVGWTEGADWTRIECGEHFERCSHYAWAHFPEAEGARVGTRDWLAGVRS